MNGVLANVLLGKKLCDQNYFNDCWTLFLFQLDYLNILANFAQVVRLKKSLDQVECDFDFAKHIFIRN